jgi:hypothetical protein
MSNPFLPLWEYIPDGEPRVFGNRVYIYGSHDNANSDKFCDYKLKVWSAPLDNLNNWVCHGHIFHTKVDRDHKPDTEWTDRELYAPDVVEKDGKYYLYAYIIGSKGCVAVSERPEGPFKLISKYKYSIPEGKGKDCFGNGWFIDPGVLVDDDGQIYIYCGYERSFVAKINPDNMYEIIDGTYKDDIIPIEKPFEFFEACSIRKVENIYYLIYSPKKGSRLSYATSSSPTGPFEYRGVIIDNGIDYPGGNNHGSICNINNQWYIFYHRMTNGTIMSRRACVEKIELLPDGTIHEVEMTSLGFESALSPFNIIPAELACILKGGCFVTEKNITERVITDIKDGCIIGFKYFDFGEDFSSETMKINFLINGTGCKSKIKIVIDDYKNGKVIGKCDIGMDDGIYSAVVENITGKHSLYFVVENIYSGWFVEMLKNRLLFNLKSFVFIK